MGLKRLADRLKVDPKKLKKQEMPCFTELMRFFGALKKVGYDADKCQAEKVALQEAINEMDTRKGHKDTINYHLQRIAKDMGIRR
ncbi:hypothetical protein KFL_003430180 [Klebsormidium nitens]|uniref:Uncharacterized protein n=1 Tax=Klebsormidium nitens TaxID=105231 RepID=A0A0U9HKG4_KLENI|nr:hypothetical protein KFL_003430180 [Klebsormidium nitens]|eukprot:GAQ87299.1 hypothetical protein KFL_003430180 [Klebsormidium nitens]